MLRNQLDLPNNAIKFYIHALYNSQNAPIVNNSSKICENNNTHHSSPICKPITDASREDTLQIDISQESIIANRKIIDQLYTFLCTAKDEKVSLLQYSIL